MFWVLKHSEYSSNVRSHLQKKFHGDLECLQMCQTTVKLGASFAVTAAIHYIQWCSQDLILGGAVKKNNLRGSEATEPERAERARGGGGRVWEGVSPSHSESFLHFDVVNGAIWCICPVFSSYSTNLYYLTLEMVERRQLEHACTQTLFSFYFRLLNLRGRGRPPPSPPPPGYATDYIPCYRGVYLVVKLEMVSSVEKNVSLKGRAILIQFLFQTIQIGSRVCQVYIVLYNTSTFIFVPLTSSVWK